MANIKFLTAKETFNFITADNDGYLAGFSQADYIARACPAGLQQYLRSIMPITPSGCIQNRIKKLCNLINNKLVKDGLTIFGTDWNFAFTYQDRYESGYSHTRADIIFLSTSALNITNHQLIKILLHEKIHVYQRKWYKYILNSLLNKGYTIIGERNPKSSLNRSNPDLDNNLWSSPLIGPMYCVYNSNNPKDMTDVTATSGTQDNEHPFELMAYEISEAFRLD